MLKVRLHGEESDITRMVELLQRLDSNGYLRILSQSGDYEDRAPSVYKRRYLDLELVPKRGGRE